MTLFSKALLLRWRFPLLVLALCAGIAALGEAGRAGLRYERLALSDGEVWRALTGHLAHGGPSHFALNAGGFLGVWWLYGAAFRARYWAVLFGLLCLGISAGFYGLNPELGFYAGLSGVLHGLLAAGALRAVGEGVTRGERPWADMVILAGLGAKIMHEQRVGAVPLTEALSGGEVIVDAHFYGAVIGALYAAAVLVLRRVNVMNS